MRNMLRVARKGVVCFETALVNPTWDQRLCMKHSGYSKNLRGLIVRLKDIVEIVEIRNIRECRFYGCPNAQLVLGKRNIDLSN